MSRIEIPGFDEFLDDMGEDRCVQWAAEANRAVERLPVHLPLTGETANEFVMAVTALNQRMTIAMLRDYHEWLIAQLSQRSVHLL